jgi:hypothetical protein
MVLLYTELLDLSRAGGAFGTPKGPARELVGRAPWVVTMLTQKLGLLDTKIYRLGWARLGVKGGPLTLFAQKLPKNAQKKCEGAPLALHFLPWWARKIT